MMLFDVAQIKGCMAAPAVTCLTQPAILQAFGAAIVIIMLLAAPWGWIRTVRDGRAAKRTVRRLAITTVDILTTGAVVIVALAYFRPEALYGQDPTRALQVLWQTTVYALAISGIVGAFAFGFGMGGWGARASGAAARLGRPGVVIAIDGPAASGKGTLAKRIAEHYRVPVLDTGLLYRAVARDVLQRGGALTDASVAIACARNLNPATFGDRSLRGATAGEAASVVARIPEVRAALLDYQRGFAKSPQGAVLDGRDIGTVVCPDAPVKIYVTASAEVRARRRHDELRKQGENVSYSEVLEDIRRRDARDMGREVAPLLPAHDAFELDTTEMNIQQAFEAAIDVIEHQLVRTQTFSE